MLGKLKFHLIGRKTTLFFRCLGYIPPDIASRCRSDLHGFQRQISYAAGSYRNCVGTLSPARASLLCAEVVFVGCSLPCGGPDMMMEKMDGGITKTD